MNCYRQQSVSSIGSASEEVLSRLLEDLRSKNLSDKIRLGGKPLFSGIYTTIYKGVYIRQYGTSDHGDMMNVAVKQFNRGTRDGSKFLKRISRELRVWVKLDHHQNILPLIGFIIQEEGDLIFPSLVSEYMERGTLRDQLISNWTFDAGEIVEGIANGISHLHAREIVHGDLKSSNIVISAEGIPKLMDFGISHILPTTSTQYAETATDAHIGSLYWMAPELIDSLIEQKHTTESDIWAFGMVIIEVLTRDIPFPGITHIYHLLDRILRGPLPEVPEKSQRQPGTNYLWNLCSEGQCWNRKPSKRPNIEDIQYILSMKDSLEAILERRSQNQASQSLGLAVSGMKLRRRNSGLSVSHSMRPRSLLKPRMSLFSLEEDVPDMYGGRDDNETLRAVYKTPVEENDGMASLHQRFGQQWFE